MKTAGVIAFCVLVCAVLVRSAQVTRTQIDDPGEDCPHLFRPHGAILLCLFCGNRQPRNDL